MPLQLPSVETLLCTVIAVCFSFAITVFTYWYKNAEESPRLLGFSFTSVFVLSASSLLSGSHELSDTFFFAAEPMLLLFFSVILLFKAIKKYPLLARAVMIAVMAILMLVLAFAAPVRAFISYPRFYLTGVTIFTLIVLYLLRNKPGETGGLFWTVLLLACSIFARVYLQYGLTIYIPILLDLAAYCGFLYYFHKVYLKFMVKNALENEKKLAEYEGTIEYEVKRRVLEIEKVNQKLVSISKIDAMSKVLNKAAILEAIDDLIEKKPKNNFSILMFDIDNFKNINDTLGHMAGDKCIRLLSASVRNNLRDIDIIGRYGGDEFLVVLPDTGAGQAITIAERFRKHIEASDSPHYTISIGIASYPSDGTDVKTLIETADAGLYKSKQKGRNAVSHRDFY
ncbi:MAG TPA: GGDEF domain-containing protein [Clostridia bacterium]|nr:GGDEF domain-containing protein [Clostridia bacterium]